MSTIASTRRQLMDSVKRNAGLLTLIDMLRKQTDVITRDLAKDLPDHAIELHKGLEEYLESLDRAERVCVKQILEDERELGID